MLKQKVYWIFILYLPYGSPKEGHPDFSSVKNIIFQSQKVVIQSWCRNMIFSAIKNRLACKIQVLYLQNQASYVHFWFVKVIWNLNSEFFFEIWKSCSNLEISGWYFAWCFVIILLNTKQMENYKINPTCEWGG